MEAESLVPSFFCEGILFRAKELGALKFGDFVFSSGKHSRYYFDGRLLSLDSQGVGLLAVVIVSLARRFHAQAVGGPTIGADPMVGAALSNAYQEGYELKGFLVRSEIKDHGMQRQVEGDLQPGTSVIVLDDVCTTGESLLRSIEAVEAKGCKVVAVFTILDHHQGGSDELRNRGYPYIALLETDHEGNVRIASKTQ